MKYVIGIDGGGTKTDLVIMDLNKNVICNSIAGPINLNSVSQEEFESNIASVINTSVSNNKLIKKDCLGVCIGTAGSGIARNREIITDTLKAIGIGSNNNIHIYDDGVTALIGTIKNKDGILLVSGTGSICIGIKAGKVFRVGGWGHIIGDEGSGYDIGRKILCCIMKSYDGRIKETLLKDLVFDKLGINNIDKLIEYIYHCSNKKEIAEIARLLSDDLILKDENSMQIANETIDELADHIFTMLKKLCTNKSTIVLNGSVILKNDFIRKGLVAKIKQKYPESQICIVENHAAAKGACYIALEKAKCGPN